MLTVDFQRLALTPGSRVLDLGCGDGRHVRATRILPGVTAVGLDLDAAQLIHTAKSLHWMDGVPSDDGGSVPGAGSWLCLRGNGYRLPFRDHAFDCVIASEVLEHLRQDSDAIDEISRVLRPAGLLAVSVPRLGPEAICWALSPAYRNSPGGHVRIYRRRSLARKLEMHGYNLFAMHFAHALHSPYWWLKCLVGPDNNDASLVRWYHSFLMWDMTRHPRPVRLLERLLNPLIGKSVVLYARRKPAT